MKSWKRALRTTLQLGMVGFFACDSDPMSEQELIIDEEERGSIVRAGMPQEAAGGKPEIAFDVPPGVEPIPNPPQLTRPNPGEQPEPGPGNGRRPMGVEDPAWRRADGRRYHSLFVMRDGSAYGWRDAPPKIDPPADAEEPTRSGPRISVGTDDHPVSPPVPSDDLSTQDRRLPGILGGSLNSDRRTRVTDIAGQLQKYPVRTVGALNFSPDPGETWCTGTMVGPRHVLTAAHCIVDSYGRWRLPEWFHPGQTRDEHPNTSGSAVRVEGVQLRDWNALGREYDYAIIYLEDRQDVVDLDYVHITYASSPAWWDNKWIRILGYPRRSSSSDWSKCKASPYANKACGGWMYRHQNSLTSDSYDPNKQYVWYDIDTTANQSGSSLLWKSSFGTWYSLGVHHGCSDHTDPWGGCDGEGRNRAARFRYEMWNDVCIWISQWKSAYGEHHYCNFDF